MSWTMYDAPSDRDYLEQFDEDEYRRATGEPDGEEGRMTDEEFEREYREAHLKERDTGYVPYREMRRWRRRFWWSLALNAVPLVLWLRSCR